VYFVEPRPRCVYHAPRIDGEFFTRYVVSRRGSTHLTSTVMPQRGQLDVVCRRRAARHCRERDLQAKPRVVHLSVEELEAAEQACRSGPTGRVAYFLRRQPAMAANPLRPGKPVVQRQADLDHPARPTDRAVLGNQQTKWPDQMRRDAEQRVALTQR